MSLLHRYTCNYC